MDSATWTTIKRLVEWLDATSNHSPELTRLLRVLKIQEEAGEVAEAIHGAMGSNPRKGASHTWTDVEKELCDVILTGMVSLATINPDAQKVFEYHLNRVADRSLAAAEPTA
ncbi:MazG-like family protein [Streptomyces litchfieldiae]|uniref:MazG-like family protein n=1 Tax=Streptomyces litchfieldiae TaxID=3075543 RepID=A0ABU2N023_9ACTN|nr:MazG-like family protein [Streptomyces sp. DSM 44938]MDT0346873.1 MazG-like family protein [Streptomyces sp. DSM 44938]